MSERESDLARKVSACEELSCTGPRGFDLNPTLPVSGHDSAWWLDYLRRHDEAWHDALRAALDSAADPDTPTPTRWEVG